MGSTTDRGAAPRAAHHTPARSLSGLIANAKRSALRRKQRPSTAHALLVMLQRDTETSAVLARRGLREVDLLSALKIANEEPNSAVDLAIERASKLADRLGEPGPRPIHLLAAIVVEPRSAGYRCLGHTGAVASQVHRDVLSALGLEEGAPPPQVRPRVARRQKPEVPPVPRARAVRRAPRVTGPQIPETPLRPVSRGRGSVVAPPAARGSEGGTATPTSPNDTTAAVNPRRPAARRGGDDGANARGPHELDPRLFPTLCRLGRNLTAAAAAGEIDPVIGREDELDRLLDVLGRRRANNPVLVGPPGVGKTAIVEGLALRLVRDGERCGPLADRVLLEVSAGSLVSGTGVRGALADKLRRIRAEVAKADGRVLLFLDEIHAIVGGDGPDDLATELKAALARGELPCIGATTEAEYRRHFERDAALVRRFTRIDVGEPGPADALAILRGLVPRYELHHGVAYDPRALDAAVELTVRYVTEGHLPDKAIAALDLAAARVRRRGGSVVEVASVARVVAEQAMVPVDRLLMRDADRLLRLEGHLAQRVVGQREPLGRISDALRKGAAGFRGRRPLGTFLLLGPTGVGKTETAKAINELIFPGSPMTRFDMSEMSEAHAVARLLGAPPGYVGHEDGGQLTESVRRRPYQLILLDEIEKAHPEVLLALLPLLDEGRMTDGRGRTVDFTNTVIVLTSNLGVSGARPERAPVGFAARGGQAPAPDRAAAGLAAARRALPPELWNRIDEPLWFRALVEEEVSEIAERLLRRVGEVMEREHRVSLEFDEAAVAALIGSGGFDAELGARPMRRCIGRLVEAPLATEILSGRIRPGGTVTLRGEGGTIVIQTVGGAGHERRGSTDPGAPSGRAEPGEQARVA